MRFDDRLNTVLAQPAANPHDRAVRWRQLVELLARTTDISSEPALRALSAVRAESIVVDQQVRAAAARAIARPQLPVGLVEVFAADAIAVAAPVLAAVSLTPHQWESVVDAASPDSRRFIRSLFPDLPNWAPPGRARRPEPEEPEYEPEGAEPGPERAPGPVTPVAERSAPAPGATISIPSISEVLARIENLRAERFADPETHSFEQEAAPAPAAPPVSPPAVPTPPRPRFRMASQPAPEAAAPLFRWECGPSGEIAWVEGVPRGSLIGRSLANPGEHNGVDQRIQRAFAVRAPFRDATLTVSGDGPAAGEWKLSGVPAFEPSDGRFAGYRGVGVRTDVATPEGEASPASREPLDEASLRELVHELKTPLNAIVGFAEIIDGQYLGPADNRYRERASEIVAQARLLLSAIEDLDVAAQLRLSGASAEGATDINALITALLPEFKDRASRKGARVEADLSRTPAICTLDRAVLERLIRRFVSSLLDASEPRERIAVGVDCDVGQCLVTATRPEALRMLPDAQLFGRVGEREEVLATGLSLKLARGIAQTAGGDLRVAGDKLALVLPRRRT